MQKYNDQGAAVTVDSYLAGQLAAFAPKQGVTPPKQGEVNPPAPYSGPDITTKEGQDAYRKWKLAQK